MGKETIEDHGSGPRWHWYNIMADLRAQGLAAVDIDPLSTRPSSVGGAHGTNRFYMTWAYNSFTLLTMQEWDEPLVHALSAILGYAPLGRYQAPGSGLVTVEWDNVDAAGRLRELRALGIAVSPPTTPASEPRS